MNFALRAKFKKRGSWTSGFARSSKREVHELRASREVQKARFMNFAFRAKFKKARFMNFVRSSNIENRLKKSCVGWQQWLTTISCTWVWAQICAWLPFTVNVYYLWERISIDSKSEVHELRASREVQKARFMNFALRAKFKKARFMNFALRAKFKKRGSGTSRFARSSQREVHEPRTNFAKS